MFNTIITILLVTTVLAVLGYCVYMHLRDKTLDEIRAEVYQLFLQAEHDPRFYTEPKKRMVWVLQRARSMLPGWTQLLISDKFLEDIVESWFRAVKDLLDDGKVNASVKEE